ncbi:VanZ family protein [Kitasatospora sp. NPDC058406]|uniref:VanZ family protein n=1 Tax=Kitasatospora sp. NPDC058406 TaxID=3346483 RepID=UPI00364CA9C6
MRTETGRPTAAHTGRATAVHHPLRVVGLLGLTLHLVLVGWLVLRPLPVAWVYDANLTPLASLHSSSLGQVLGELLLPAPLGLLLPLAGGRLRAPWLLSFLRTTGASALLATALEFLSSWAPGHVLNVDHILLAVVGVGITHLALVPAGRSLLLRRATAPRAPAPRSTASRATASRAMASRPTVSARVQAPAAAPTAAPTSAPAVYAEPVAGRGH